MTNQNQITFNEEQDKFYKEKLLNNVPGFESTPSKAIFSIDIPEVSNIKAEFVYNYFVKNERDFENSSQSITIGLTDDTADIEFFLAQKKDPRYVLLNFNYANDSNFSDYNIEGLNVLITQNLDKLFVEGTSSSKYFVGSELVDTYSDKKFYELLKTTTIVPQVEARLGSNMEAANHLCENLINGDISGAKKLIRDSLSHTQPDGIAYAPGDTRLEDTLTALDPNGPTGRQTFSLKMNKTFFAKVVKQSNKIAGSVFEDELRAYLPILQEYAANSYQNLNPNEIKADEYNLTVIPVSAQPIETWQEVYHQVYGEYPSNLEIPKKSIAGYVIEKFEVGAGGDLTPKAPIIVENANRSYIVDRNVKYGKTYYYKVRTVAVFEMYTVNEFNQGIIAKILVLSEGSPVSIECIEMTPPDPPENLIIEFDYKYFKPVITWDFPTNPQRDIKRFQVFKRTLSSEPFTLIAEYDFDDSLKRVVPLEVAPEEQYYRLDYPLQSFRDDEFDINSSAVYAVACVDAHGLTSNYSTQMRVRYDKFKNKLIQELFSFSGAPKSYPNIYLNNDLFIDTMKVSGKDRLTIIFDPEYYVVNQNVRDEVNNQTVEKDLKLIATNPQRSTYKLQIINTDYQDSEIINIKIKDESSLPISLDPSSINSQNLSFHFGINN